MKKLLFVIGLALGGYAVGAAQTAATATHNAAGSTAKSAACCQKGGEAKACCAKGSTSTAEASKCSGHDSKTQKAEAAQPATPSTRSQTNEKPKTSR